MMRFPLIHLLDEAECYRYLERVLHPDGFACPNGHPLPPPSTRTSPIRASSLNGTENVTTQPHARYTTCRCFRP